MPLVFARIICASGQLLSILPLFLINPALAEAISLKGWHV